MEELSHNLFNVARADVRDQTASLIEAHNLFKLSDVKGVGI